MPPGEWERLVRDERYNGEMDLGDVPTEQLRKELHKREEAKKAAEWEALCAAHPCPECGANPARLSDQMVEDFVFAPKDNDGRPMLYAPYEMGETHGARYETQLTCVNGHTTYSDRIKWFDKPQPGPILPRR